MKSGAGASDAAANNTAAKQGFGRRRPTQATALSVKDAGTMAVDPPARDRTVLRELARRVAEIAALPEQGQKADAWRRHNRLDSPRPMVLVFPEGSWRELIPQGALACVLPLCRHYEMDLRRRIYHWEHLRDDNVVDGTIVSPVVVHNSGWGIDAEVARPSEPLGAARYEPVLREESDLARLRKPTISIDWEETERRYQAARETFEPILTVEKRGSTRTGFAIVDLLARWRGLEQLLWDMVDRPAWLHRALRFLTEGMLGVLEAEESAGVLSLNNGAHYCGSGGVGFSDELPQPDFDGEHVRAIDMWGFATTQIFSEVSPAMHEEFALAYEKLWLSRFGLNAYGCCEPLHKKMAIVKQIPRLRRVSMSPWVDMAEGAEQMGDRYIFSRKPNPAVLAAPTWEPDAVRRSIRRDLERTRGCVVELVMKDTHTCLNQPHRMSEWVRIAKQEAEEFAE